MKSITALKSELSAKESWLKWNQKNNKDFDSILNCRARSEIRKLENEIPYRTSLSEDKTK